MKEITLAILAGGEGSRMGGSKGLLMRGRTPILVHLLNRFSWEGPTLLVTAPGRENPAGWERFTRQAVDAVAGEGPLRGLLTVAEAITTSAALVTTVDMPEVSAGQLRWLAEQLGESPAAFLSRVGRIEPFPCAITSGVGDVLRDRLQTGGRSVRGLALQSGMAIIEAPADWPEATWTNLNTPEDLAKWNAADGA